MCAVRSRAPSPHRSSTPPHAGRFCSPPRLRDRARSGSAIQSCSVQDEAARPVSTLAPAERTRRWPEVLPGRKAVIFTVGWPESPDDYDNATIEATVIATGERRLVWSGAAMSRLCTRISAGSSRQVARLDTLTHVSCGICRHARRSSVRQASHWPGTRQQVCRSRR